MKPVTTLEYCFNHEAVCKFIYLFDVVCVIGSTQNTDVSSVWKWISRARFVNPELTEWDLFHNNHIKIYSNTSHLRINDC